MFGTNPHGQGTAASVALTPSTVRPQPYNQSGNPPDSVVVGRGRSEELGTNGPYHAHITILSVLGLQTIPGVDATQGQTVTGPVAGLNTTLANLCNSTGKLICLSIAAANAAATATGAVTHFELAHATIAGQLPGGGAVDLGAGQSDSSIQTNFVTGCQTSTGSSSVVGGLTLVGIHASVSKASESSTACPGQAPVQTASSSVVGLGGVGVALSPLLVQGCANGTPNSVGGLLPPLLITIICNADSTSQLPAPSGVREALSELTLGLGNTVLAKAVTAAGESFAVAQTPHPPVVCPDSDHDCGIGKNGNPEQCVNHKDLDGDADCSGNRNTVKPNKCKDADHDCGILPNGQHEVCDDGHDPDHDGDCVLPNGNREGLGISTGGPAATEAAAKGQLPFTGQNVLELIVLGLLLTGGGLGIALGLRAREH